MYIEKEKIQMVIINSLKEHFFTTKDHYGNMINIFIICFINIKSQTSFITKILKLKTYNHKQICKPSKLLTDLQTYVLNYFIFLKFKFCLSG